MPAGVRIDASPEQLGSVSFNADGLVAAIAQDVDTREAGQCSRAAAKQP